MRDDACRYLFHARHNPADDVFMTSTSLHATSRVAASLLGGYAFTWGFTVFGIALLVVVGMSYHEAQTLIFMLAFLVFLAVFCWAFAAASVTRVWGVLVAGGVAMTVAAWWLSSTLHNVA